MKRIALLLIAAATASTASAALRLIEASAPFASMVYVQISGDRGLAIPGLPAPDPSSMLTFTLTFDTANLESLPPSGLPYYERARLSVDFLGFHVEDYGFLRLNERGVHFEPYENGYYPLDLGDGTGTQPRHLWSGQLEDSEGPFDIATDPYLFDVRPSAGVNSDKDIPPELIIQSIESGTYEEFVLGGGYLLFDRQSPYDDLNGSPLFWDLLVVSAGGPIHLQTVPEPSTYGLIGAGLIAGIAGARKLRSRGVR